MGGGNSNIFYFHPENWGTCSPNFDEHSIFFKRVEFLPTSCLNLGMLSSKESRCLKDRQNNLGVVKQKAKASAVGFPQVDGWLMVGEIIFFRYPNSNNPDI